MNGKHNKQKLINAKANQDDEFYTRYKDIAKEVIHYHDQLKDKIVYCNADGDDSQFVKYFIDNFDIIGLKKLIYTHYVKQDLLSEGQAYKVTYNGKTMSKENLKGDGGYKSPESLRILSEADIVITNPPFSIFRDYFNTLMAYDKDFLIIGSNNAVAYMDVWKHVQAERVNIGIFGGGANFDRPDGTIKGVAIFWYTTLDINSKRPQLELTKTYNAKDYPKYDNYDAINVNRTVHIPKDYKGIIGVPITYLLKHDPKRFEIMGVAKTPLCHDNKVGAERIKYYSDPFKHHKGQVDRAVHLNNSPTVNFKEVPSEPYYTVKGEQGYFKALYVRILIKRR